MSEKGKLVVCRRRLKRNARRFFQKAESFEGVAKEVSIEKSKEWASLLKWSYERERVKTRRREDDKKEIAFRSCFNGDFWSFNFYRHELKD